MFEGELEEEAEVIKKLVEEIRAEVAKDKFNIARNTLVKIKTTATKMNTSLRDFIQKNRFSHGLLEDIFARITKITEKCRLADNFIFELAKKFDSRRSTPTPRKSFEETILREITVNAQAIIDTSKYIRKSIGKEF